jgi:hypothetical protein
LEGLLKRRDTVIILNIQLKKGTTEILYGRLLFLFLMLGLRLNKDQVSDRMIQFTLTGA